MDMTETFDVEYATKDNGFATMDLAQDEADRLAAELKADPDVISVKIVRSNDCW